MEVEAKADVKAEGSVDVEVPSSVELASGSLEVMMIDPMSGGSWQQDKKESHPLN